MNSLFPSVVCNAECFYLLPFRDSPLVCLMAHDRPAGLFYFVFL
jgi:hypothetical protein